MKTLWTVLAGLLLASTVAAADVTTGNPGLKSIDSISFGPEGLLLIGDGTGAQVVTVQTGDTTPIKWSKTDVADIKEQLGGRLGTNAKGIDLVKLAVNPASQRAYVLVRKLDSKQDVILTVDGQGKIQDFGFDKVKYTSYKLPAEKGPVVKITDITFADGRILLAVQASGTFASKIFSIDTRQSDASPYWISTETYHVAHGKWETNAPIRTVMPYKEGGKSYLVGAFTCTPIVKYSLDDLKSGERVKGQSVIELGNGNTPKDMFPYEKGGKSFILMNNSRNAKFHQSNPVGPSPNWVAKVEYSILQENEKINEKALRRVGKKASDSQTERAVVVPEFTGVILMDRLDAERALVIRTDDKGGYNLAVLALP